MNLDAANEAASALWARRLAWGVWISTAVLVAFGGVITTLRAGMAIDGWWVLDRGNGDHFLLLYPIEKWFATKGTFSEHTHRLVGVVVGLLSIGYVVARWLERPRNGVKFKLAIAGLLAVCAQGAVGGFRVLENSENLAFLHGALAQLVFALLGVNVVLSSRNWDRARLAGEARPSEAGALPSARVAWIAAAVIYAQTVLGAWLRHTGFELALALHLVFAAVAVGVVLNLSRTLRRAAPAAPLLERAGRRLLHLLMLQLSLGLATLLAIVVSGGFKAEVTALETITATSHVLIGALLLQQAVAGALWIRRLSSVAPAIARQAPPRSEPTPSLSWKAAP